MATPTSACASAGASLVPSPVMATSLPCCCSRLMSSILVSGVASARKSSTPASSAITAAVSGLSPVIITVRMPMARIWSKRSRMPPLTMSLRWMTPRARSSIGHGQRRAALARDLRQRRLELGRHLPAVLTDPGEHRVAGALADRVAVEVDAAHARLRGELDELGVLRVDVPAADAELLGQHHDGAALGRLVGQRGELGGVGELLHGDSRHGEELRRLAVAERDGAGLVEQQRVDVAGGLDGAPGHRQHVVAHEAVHAGDADRREQTADGRRDEADEQRDQHRDRDGRVAVDGERLQRHDDEQEDDRQPGEQDVERDLVGRLLPLGALDERDHAVEERLAGVGRDAHLDPVREHAGAAGDGAAVAAALADDRRRLAGDGGLVDRGDALDDVAVAGDDLAGDHEHDVALAQLARGDLLASSPSTSTLASVSVLVRAQRVGLRLAAALRHRRRRSWRTAR